MIAKAEWFSQRKFGGWGLTPNCWQGWAYIALVAAPIIFIQYLNLPGMWAPILMIAWSLFFVIDFVIVFLNLKKDERDTIHEAIAERNAIWFMVTALGLGIAYQVAVGIINQVQNVDPIIIIALMGSMVVKAITHFYLRNK